jgi:hypothetical protein
MVHSKGLFICLTVQIILKSVRIRQQYKEDIDTLLKSRALSLYQRDGR